ncbi:MAG: LysR family transcriptional regulator [Ruminococcaceae bacterium]|nr:LysR family transcriptional regulator [Oscillospiraceae bacterium]
MEFLQLKYFCDAAVSENFSRTAKKFGVPASDISQSIRRLERELGLELFFRRANSIQLNDKGREFYTRVSKSLALIDDALIAVKDVESRGKIKICINSNRRIVMEVIEKYRRVYPDVEIVTTHFTDPTSEDFDMIIDSGEERLLGYNKTLLISEPLQLAMKKDCKFAADEKIDIKKLSDEVFVTMSDKSNLYYMTNSICRDFGFIPKIAMQSDDPFYVRKCVELGLGFCFVPSFSWQGQFSDDVVLKEIEGYIRHTYIFTDPKKHITLCAKRFLDMLLSEAVYKVVD